MNNEAVILTAIFWFSFAFSPGPFWMAWMNYHTQRTHLKIYRDYLIYVCLVFSTHSFVLAVAVYAFGYINENLFIPLYFIGGSFIIYLGIKSFYLHTKSKKISFNLKHMTMLSLSNPKVYLTVPTGALGAFFFEDNMILNALIFSTVFLIPINILGSVFFMLIAKASYKIALDKVNYFISSLLIFYGVYLMYKGIIEVINY